MKAFAVALFALIIATPALAAISHFDHVVIMVQENRSPDNLFYALCATRTCGTHPDSRTYDIKVDNWLDRKAKRGAIHPIPSALNMIVGPDHSHAEFLDMCDYDARLGACRMDGAGDIPCRKCPPHTQFTYVSNADHLIDAYLYLAKNYGWANYMFQTNQGASFPAHQYLFGATSAPSATEDHKGTFVADNENSTNATGTNQFYGCVAPPDARVPLIRADGVVNRRIYPCLEHKTLGDLLDAAKVSWRYYTPGPGSLWSAPDAIRHICQPGNGVCRGSIWRKHLALNPPDVLTDIRNCALSRVSWVIPSAQYSDHYGIEDAGGPFWVASVINAIGDSACKNSDGTSYWDSTAIVVVWDDWGGYYDHEPPTFLAWPEGGYQYGFRVPMLFVSAYTEAGYIDNDRHDFGDIARFIEYNSGIAMGKLTFADARSTGNLQAFYDLSAAARAFRKIPTGTSGLFGGFNGRLEPPDDD